VERLIETTPDKEEALTQDAKLQGTFKS